MDIQTDRWTDRCVCLSECVFLCLYSVFPRSEREAGQLESPVCQYFCTLSFAISSPYLLSFCLSVSLSVCLSCSTLLRFLTKEGPHLFLFLSLSVSLPACLSQTHGSFVVAHVPFHFLSGSIYSFPLLPKTPVNT